MAKQKNRGLEVAPPAAAAHLETNGQANKVLLRLARLIGRQMARESFERAVPSVRVIATPERAGVEATHERLAPLRQQQAVARGD
jgi:hypothetical protein